MKKIKKICFGFAILFMIPVITANLLFSQITINSTDIPSEIGTLIITKDDTVEAVEVDVGLPGENQIWRFDQDFPGVLTRQHIVAIETTPFNQHFPTADFAIRSIQNKSSSDILMVICCIMTLPL